MIDPPIPCGAPRAMIRNSALGDRAHNNEASENSASPTVNT